jgi:hypothetical protein
MDAFVTRSTRHEATALPEASMSGGAVGQQMKVSQLKGMGPEEKKEKRDRPDSVKMLTVPEPPERKRKKRVDITEYHNLERAVQMAKKYPELS